jgi:hypothetical protein
MKITRRQLEKFIREEMYARKKFLEKKSSLSRILESPSPGGAMSGPGDHHARRKGHGGRGATDPRAGEVHVKPTPTPPPMKPGPILPGADEEEGVEGTPEEAPTRVQAPNVREAIRQAIMNELHGNYRGGSATLGPKNKDRAIQGKRSNYTSIVDEPDLKHHYVEGAPKNKNT